MFWYAVTRKNLATLALASAVEAFPETLSDSPAGIIPQGRIARPFAVEILPSRPASSVDARCRKSPFFENEKKKIRKFFCSLAFISLQQQCILSSSKHQGPMF
jgi:hypothetical protein